MKQTPKATIPWARALPGMLLPDLTCLGIHMLEPLESTLATYWENFTPP
jgi:hypothetical protein